jgi:hypothetical protein
VLLQIIILHPATLNSSRLFRFIELRRGISGKGPPPREISNKAGIAVSWATPSSGFFPKQKPPPRAHKKSIFTPVFAQI